MHWAYPERWIWCWLLPALIGFWVWASRNRRRLLERFVAPALLPHLAAAVNWEARRLKAACVAFGLLFMLLALVGPQWGFRWQEVTRKGVDLVIALDVSNSMLAEDVKPNRLERAKLAIKELLPQLPGDRVALVAFAGTAFTQCPLTVDYGAFELVLDEVDTDLIPRGGTDLAAAIRESLDVLKASTHGSRALVLISDGESQSGNITAAAKEAAEAGVAIYAIGIGTPDGELIPVTDEHGNRSFLKDREGRTVKSRLDETGLQQAALASGGSYVRATPTSFGLDLLYREQISKLDKQELESTMKKQAEMRFQWPLALAVLLLALEPWLSDRKRAPA